MRAVAAAAICDSAVSLPRVAAPTRLRSCARRPHGLRTRVKTALLHYRSARTEKNRGGVMPNLRLSRRSTCERSGTGIMVALTRSRRRGASGAPGSRMGRGRSRCARGASARRSARRCNRSATGPAHRWRPFESLARTALRSGSPNQPSSTGTKMRASLRFLSRLSRSAPIKAPVLGAARACTSARLGKQSHGSTIAAGPVAPTVGKKHDREVYFPRRHRRRRDALSDGRL